MKIKSLFHKEVYLYESYIYSYPGHDDIELTQLCIKKVIAIIPRITVTIVIQNITLIAVLLGYLIFAIVIVIIATKKPKELNGVGKKEESRILA